MNKKQLIVSLIRDDLVSTRLVNGLGALGLDAGHYSLHLSETILRLLGFTHHQLYTVFNQYLKLTQLAQHVPRNNPAKLNQLALEIYHALLTLKPQPATQKPAAGNRRTKTSTF